MDDVETQLAVTLADEAERVDVPWCDPGGILVAGRREVQRTRRRATWYAVAGVAAFVLVLTGVGLAVRQAGEGGRAPQGGTVSHGQVPAPRVGKPATPYWSAGYLHLGSRRIAMAEPVIESADGATLVAMSPDTDAMRVALVAGQDLIVLHSAVTEPVISANGQYGAWEASTGSTGSGSYADHGSGRPLFRLELWDLTAAKPIAQQDFRSHAECCDAPSLPVGVDASGRVYVWDGGHPLVWDHRDQSIHPIRGIAGGDLEGASPRGPVFAMTSRSSDKGDPGLSVYGAQTAGGSFTRTGTFPSQEGAWSASGARVAYIGGTGSPMVRTVSSGRDERLDLPAGHYVISAWVSDTVLLVNTYEPQRTVWFQCDTVTRLCGPPAVLPPDGRVVLPDPG